MLRIGLWPSGPPAIFGNNWIKAGVMEYRSFGTMGEN